MPSYDFILLDADNTLFDFDLAEALALEDTLTAYGCPVTAENLHLYHLGNKSLWKAFEQGAIRQDEILERRFRLFLEEIGQGHQDGDAMNVYYMDRLVKRSQIYPGAEDFCRSLKARCTLVLVTNGVAVMQRGRLESSPICDLFSHVFISTELGCQKPDPQFFDIVCQQAGITDRRRAVVVGDSLSSDILGGNRSGIDTIWYNPKGLPKSEIIPTYEVCDYSEAQTLILGKAAAATAAALT